MANDNKDKVLTKKQFLRKHMTDNVKGAIYGSSLLLIINAIFTFALVLSGNITSLIDCIVVATLAIVIIKFYSRVAASIVLVYAVINTVIMTIHTDQLGGWMLIIPAVIACIGVFYLDKKYKGYLNVKKEESQDNN